MPPKRPVADRTHASLEYTLSEVEHAYGPHIHILSNPYSMSLLARLGSPRTSQPVVNELVRRLYSDLLTHVVCAEFPLVTVAEPTRMAALHPKEGVYRGEIVDPKARVVCVNIARAGTLPSQVCFETLSYLMDAAGVRQDHVFMNRRTNAKGQVVGVDLSGSKIGGPMEGAIVLIPDPMGATGGSMLEAVRQLTKSEKPRKLIALHLIITPEYCRAVGKSGLALDVYAVRLDRGFSPPAVLGTEPGIERDRERGLNDRQYIVPGAGGLGELMNNAER
ncbi:MAG: uracil phosphoribosyltransferase [Planctomycetes bacterium]|nr:uracil phosphoribosyltransferase [Planctomycetota bacterium]